MVLLSEAPNKGGRLRGALQGASFSVYLVPCVRAYGDTQDTDGGFV